MGILPLKKRVNRDKCSFATKQRMFGVFAIDEILRYRGSRIPGSPTLCHPGCHQEVNQLSEISKLPSGKAFFRTDEEENVEMMRVVIFKMSINVNTHSLDLTANVPLNKIV